MDTQKSLHYAKAFYFLYYGAWAFLLPFLALYYKGLNFTGSQIGMLASISPLVSLFAAPFWGGFSDATQRHKPVLLAALAGSAVFIFTLSQAKTFWLISIIVASYAFFTATIMPLVDNSVLSILGQRRDLYGSQRLWGAIGWGIAGPAAGWLIGRYGLSWSFAGYIIIICVGLLVAIKLPVLAAPPSLPFWQGVRVLLTQKRLLLFMMIVFISGAGMSVVTNFLFLFMEELHSSRALMGLALAFATISELPVLFYSGKMLRRWGPGGLLIISLAALVVRAFLYAFASAPWQVLIIQLLHGLTFSTMWVAGVSFVAEIAPEGLGATAQGLFTSTVSGFAGITGSLVGGVLFDNYGGAGMFLWSGSAVLIGLLVFLLINRKFFQHTE